MQDEIETEEIIKDIFQQGKTCFIPRYQFQSNHMDMVKLASPEEIFSLPKTSWNIHQPGEDEVREEALSTAYCMETVIHGTGTLADCIHGNVIILSEGRTCTKSCVSKSTLVITCSFFSVILCSSGLDLIFMPGLGFDRQGNRLGRGRGYYDAYLKRCAQQQHAKPYTVALAFKEQICLQVPVDENDVKVDEVLYEDSSAS